MKKLERGEPSMAQRKGSDVIGVAMSPDGQRIAITYRDRLVSLWNGVTMQRIISFGVATKVANLAYPAEFSPDGLRIAAAYEESSTGIWRTENGRLENVLLQDAWVFGSRFSKDSRRLVTYSIDHTARVWDVTANGTLAVLSGHTGNANGAVFNLRGDLVATGSADGTARVWQLFRTTQQLVDAAKLAVPRCLSGDEREKFFLEPEPPRRCITGTGLEAERDPTKWRPIWPYQGAEWRRWLSARDRGMSVEAPHK
jgi:WD40 repeat protein